MCQTNNKLVKLEKDRIAYKLEGQCKHDHNLWVALFSGRELKRNTPITASGSPKLKNIKHIEEGYFHCTATRKTAKSLFKWALTLRRLFKGVRIVKVIIPAKYNTVYTGIFETFGESICARKIILTDEVVWESK